MRYVITTWYESSDGTKYMESAPDFVQGDPKKHIAGAKDVMAKTRPDFDIIPANARPKVLCEPYGFDPAKYGTASEVSEAVGVARTTLIDGAKRGEIRHTYTAGVTLLIEIAAAKRWAKGTRKTGPKPKD